MPPLISRTITTRRVTCVYRTREYGYCPHIVYRDFQESVAVTRILGIPLPARVIDREEIPSHAVISSGCFGDTGGWKSRFAGIIDSCRRNGIPPAPGIIYRRKTAFCD